MSRGTDIERGWRRIPAPDGIRGIAVLGVLFHHLDQLTGGHPGVDTFFVLSVFLITGILLDERGRVDRARRPIPALVVVLAAVPVVESLLLDGISGSLRRETWAAVFYMVWPLLVIAAFAIARRRSWNGPCALAVAAGALAAVSYLLTQMLWSPENTLLVHSGTDTRVGAILLGAVAAVIVFETAPPKSAIIWIGQLALVGLVPIAASWVALDGQSELLSRIGFPVTALATTVVIAATALQPDSLLARTMSNPVLRWFGAISCGLYLWHWPIIVWLDPARTGWDGPALDAVLVVLSISVAALSYHLIEQPVRYSDWGGRRTALASIAALAVVAVGHHRPRPPMSRLRYRPPSAPFPTIPPTNCRATWATVG